MDRLLTHNERQVYQALRARGYSVEEARETALDGVSITTARAMPDLRLPPNSIRRFDGDLVDVIVIDSHASKYFLADYRDYGVHEDDPWWCVHQGTSSQSSIRGKIAQLERHRKPVFIVFRARNITQVNDWMIQHGCIRENGKIKPAQTGENMATFGVGENPHMTARDRKIRAAQRRIEQEQARIEKLESLPAEPVPTDEDNSACVWFQKTFGGNRVYTYCAVLADGLWWTSGPKGGGVGRSWDELVEWIIADNEFPTIYVATEWEPLN